MINANIRAREAFTGEILSKGITYPQLTAHEAQNILHGHLLKGIGYATQADCTKVLAELTHKLGRADAKAALDRFGCKDINDLHMGLNNKFVAYVRMAIDFGLSPQDPWNVEDHNPKLRTRWLMFHGNSDSLFECNSYDEFINSLTTEDCDDVSGIQSFEQLFKEQQRENTQPLL